MLPHKTVRAYMAERGGEQWKNAMLLEVTGHWMAAHRDKLSDNSQSCIYSKHKHRLKRVVDGWIVKTAKKR